MVLEALQPREVEVVLEALLVHRVREEEVEAEVLVSCSSSCTRPGGSAASCAASASPPRSPFFIYNSIATLRAQNSYLIVDHF